MWEMYRPTGDVKQILPPSSTHAYGGLSFANDGDYVYYWDFSIERHLTSLYKISLIGGVPKKLIDNIKSATFIPSPDGKQVALARYEGKDRASIFVANKDGTGERLLATRDGSKEWLGESPAWSPKLTASCSRLDKSSVITVVLVRNVASQKSKSSP